MIEIPLEAEAAVVAERVNRSQMFLLENRHLAVELRALKADFAELKQGHEAELAELQKSVRRTRSEVLWLLSQEEKFESDVKFLMAERHRVETLTPLDSQHSERLGDHDLNAKDQERARQLAEIPTSKTRGNEAYTLENSHPPLIETDQSAIQAIKSIALTNAGGLESTRTEAIMSGQEQAFIVDVEKRLVRNSSSGDPKLINSDLNLILHTAKSELLSSRSGRIVVLPDGTSTGGRIDLELYGGRATVGIDWSTGAVTVEM
jgi:general secretion pathway protein H